MPGFEAHQKAPFVKMWFTDTGDESNPTVTVGNDSCPNCNDKNTAVIKSFDYGISDGMQCKIEILDEEGGTFDVIANKVSKCINKASSDYQMKVQFGWVGTTCGSETELVKTSPTLTFIPINIEVHWSNGAIRYTITGGDTMQYVFASRKTNAYGSDLHRKTLTEALEEMFGDEEPKIKVRRARREGKTMKFDDEAYVWKDIDEVGSSWTADGQNKLSVAMKWIESFRTEPNNKGVVPIWNGGADSPELFLMEDPGEDCECNATELGFRSVGTYIVNGGGCSAVLDFVPNINWVAAIAVLGTGGQAGGPAKAELRKRDNKRATGCKVQSDDAGTQQSMPLNKHQLDSAGFDKATEETEEGQKAQAKANNVSQMTRPIEAELKIIGDVSPEYIMTPKMRGRTLALCVINPWHLRQSGSGSGCSDFTIRPPTNPILSNKYWWILSAHHNIKEGSFVTTLKLILIAPGIDISGGDNPGCDPLANWASDAC